MELAVVEGSVCLPRGEEMPKSLKELGVRESSG
jgi:hypothetical protein